MENKFDMPIPMQNQNNFQQYNSYMNYHSINDNPIIVNKFLTF